jgi:uncharacterized membrane protein HdeD (DUF308 family)
VEFLNQRNKTGTVDLTEINAASGILGVFGGLLLLVGYGFIGAPAIRVMEFASVAGFILLAGSFYFTALRHKKSDERDEFEAVLIAALSLLIFALAALMPSLLAKGILAIAATSLLFSSVIYYHLIHVYPNVKNWVEEKIL